MTASATGTQYLLGGKPIPFLGVTGEKGDGKTTFLSMISPGTTFYIDSEHGTDTFTDYGYKKVVKMPFFEKASDTFRWFLKEMDGVVAGEYRLLCIDVLRDMEEGAVDWVAERYASFGYTSEEAFRNTGAMFLNKVDQELKRVLSTFVKPKFETVAYATHQKDEWRGKTPTGRRKEEGRKCWLKLAALYLYLSREAVQSATGMVQPESPTAMVISSRLTSFEKNEDGSLVLTPYGDPVVHPVLPPRIPSCTPGMIRAYFVNPANYLKLKKGEKFQSPELTDDQRRQQELELETLRSMNLQASRENLEIAKEMRPKSSRAQALRESVQPATEKATKEKKTSASGVKPTIPEAPKTVQTESDPVPDGTALQLAIECRHLIYAWNPAEYADRIAKLFERYNNRELEDLPLDWLQVLMQQLISGCQHEGRGEILENKKYMEVSLPSNNGQSAPEAPTVAPSPPVQAMTATGTETNQTPTTAKGGDGFSYSRTICAIANKLGMLTDNAVRLRQGIEHCSGGATVPGPQESLESAIDRMSEPSARKLHLLLKGALDTMDQRTGGMIADSQAGN